MPRLHPASDLKAVTAYMPWRWLDWVRTILKLVPSVCSMDSEWRSHVGCNGAWNVTALTLSQATRAFSDLGSSVFEELGRPGGSRYEY